MALKDIMAVSGQPGLFRFLSQGRNGIIVESLVDGKRSHISTSAKVSALSDISIFTNSGDKPLREVLELIKNKEGGKPTISHKAEGEELKKYFTQLLPDYDDQKVYVSDIKKVVAWYNLLQSKDMLDFKEEEPEEEKTAGGEEATDKQDTDINTGVKKEQLKVSEGKAKQPVAKKPTTPKAKATATKEPAAKSRIRQKKT